MRRKKIFRFFDRYFGIPVVLVLAFFNKKKRRLPIENINNILIIKLAAIGDAILLIPALRKLKNSFLHSKITFICSDINLPVIEKIPYIDKVINCRVYDFIKNPLNFIRFVKILRKTKYELIIDAGQWERVNSVITCFANKDYSIGFKTKNQFKHVMNDTVVEHRKDKHELENFMDLLMPLGLVPVTSKIPFDELQLEYFLTQDDRNFISKFWVDNKLESKVVLCFHPGCGENGKPREWDISNYIELSNKLYLLDNNIKIIITGTNLEKPICNVLHNATKVFSINTAGNFTLEQSAALIERAKMIVCSNTGILHISTCVGTTTIGLHGPTNPVKWGAYSPKAVVIQSDKFCSPCLYLGHDYGCNKPTCMKNISVEQVFKAIINKLYI
jgi:ADP-heptose:LPS heptosyltransferase